MFEKVTIQPVLKGDSEIKSSLGAVKAEYYEKVKSIFSRKNIAAQIQINSDGGRTKNAEFDGLVSYGRSQLTQLENLITNSY